MPKKTVRTPAEILLEDVLERKRYNSKTYEKVSSFLELHFRNTFSSLQAENDRLKDLVHTLRER